MTPHQHALARGASTAKATCVGRARGVSERPDPRGELVEEGEDAVGTLLERAALTARG